VVVITKKIEAKDVLNKAAASWSRDI